MGRHEPDAQLVFGAPVGRLEAPVREPEILGNRRDQRQPEEMSLMVSWDIPSKFTKMSKQVSIWLGSINLLPDSFVSTKIEMSIPESVLKMSSPDAPALVVCNVLTTHCLKLVKAKMRGTDQGPNGNAVPLHS